MPQSILRVLLVILGLVQSVGFVTQLPWLKGVGLLTVASPLPIVFTQQKGVETFAHEFSIQYVDEDGSQNKIPITPTLYSRFNAPYQYRNILGAAISYGPILPEPLWKPVLNFAFINPGKLSHSLGILPPKKVKAIHLKTKTANRNDSWILNIE
ncbi:MAG: hypothetical protein ACKVQC_01060 [Elusimicrobiota bacterium]